GNCPCPPIATLPWGATPAGGRAGRGRQPLADALKLAPFAGTALQACVPTGGYRPCGLLPLWATTPAGYCPCERHRPLLRAIAPASDASLPCGLLPLRAAPASLAGCCPCERRRPPLRAGPGRSRPPPCRGPWPRPGRGWPALYRGWPWLAAPPPRFLHYENTTRTCRTILRDSISSHVI
ncbi:hypothetical protein BHM03_00047322, partial [Ensete ventricosum]